MAWTARILCGTAVAAGVNHLLFTPLFALSPFRPRASLAAAFARSGFRACVFLRIRFEAAWFAFVHKASKTSEPNMCQTQLATSG
jgi:hypothetical protein